VFYRKSNALYSCVFGLVVDMLKLSS